MRAAAVKLGSLAALLIVAAGGIALYGLPAAAGVRAAVDAAGAAGPFLVVAGCAALTMLLTPRAGIAALAGAVFGTAEALGYVLVGAVLGATASFAVGRMLGRDGVRRLAGARWQRVDGWLDRNGFLTVVLARLLPVVPFGLLNYGFGTTNLRLRLFCPATALGILPSTAVYVIAGRWAATDPVLALTATAGFTTLTLSVAAALRYRAIIAWSRSRLARIRSRPTVPR